MFQKSNMLCLNVKHCVQKKHQHMCLCSLRHSLVDIASQMGLSKCLASLLIIETKDKKYLDIFAKTKHQESGNIVAAYSGNFNDRLDVFVRLLPTIVARS